MSERVTMQDIERIMPQVVLALQVRSTAGLRLGLRKSPIGAYYHLALFMFEHDTNGFTVNDAGQDVILDNTGMKLPELLTYMRGIVFGAKAAGVNVYDYDMEAKHTFQIKHG